MDEFTKKNFDIIDKAKKEKERKKTIREILKDL